MRRVGDNSVGGGTGGPGGGHHCQTAGKVLHVGHFPEFGAEIGPNAGATLVR